MKLRFNLCLTVIVFIIAQLLLGSQAFSQFRRLSIDTTKIKPLVLTSPNVITAQPSSIGRLRPRAQIPFQAFDLNDFKKGGIPNDTILNIPNGKKIPVTVFLDSVNSLENRINKLGYSLRTIGKNTKLPNRYLNSRTLYIQKNRIDSRHEKSAPPKYLIMSPQQRKAVMSNSSMDTFRPVKLSRALQNPNIQTVDLSQYKLSLDTSMSVTFGNPGWFATDLSADLSLSGSLFLIYNCKAEFNSSAGAAVVGNSFRIIEANGSILSDTLNVASADINIDILGSTVLSNSLSIANDPVLDEYSMAINVPYTYRFNVGPIPFQITIGVRGEAGLEYSLSPGPMRAETNVNPYVISELYAYGGPDIYIGGAGLRCDLTILNDDLNLHGAAEARTDCFGATWLYGEYSCHNTYDALSGVLSAYAYFYYPCLSEGICEAYYSYDLWSWEGFTGDGYLFYGTVQSKETPSYIDCLQLDHRLQKLETYQSAFLPRNYDFENSGQ